MSYILDALRRADSERERGGVPSLHARPMPEALADADEDEAPRRSQPLLWAVIVLLVLLVAVLAWQFLGSRAPEPVPLPAPPVASLTPPAPAPVPPEPLAPAPITPALPSATQAPATVAPRPAPPPPVRSVQRQPQRAEAKAPVPASAAEPERPVLAYNELPDNIRRELPQLVVGGAMYSQTPASRMLILNGQVFHEGDKVAGGLVLEQIKLKSAVLAYKGYRYGINY